MGTTPEDMEQSRLWSGNMLYAPEALPFSFVFAGRKITGIPASWKPDIRRRRIDANLVETLIEGNDAQTGLHVRAECLE